MHTLRGTCCDGCRSHINPRHPEKCDVLRGRYPFRQLTPGNVPRLFCKASCIRLFLDAKDQRSLDRPTRAWIEDLFYRAERFDAFLDHWLNEADRAASAVVRGVDTPDHAQFNAGWSAGVRAVVMELSRGQLENHIRPRVAIGDWFVETDKKVRLCVVRTDKTGVGFAYEADGTLAVSASWGDLELHFQEERRPW